MMKSISHGEPEPGPIITSRAIFAIGSCKLTFASSTLLAAGPCKPAFASCKLLATGPSKRTFAPCTLLTFRFSKSTLATGALLAVGILFVSHAPSGKFVGKTVKNAYLTLIVVADTSGGEAGRCGKGDEKDCQRQKGTRGQHCDG